MKIFLAATGSGMTRQLKKETIKKCKPLYILETFFNGEKACLEAMNIVGNENFLLDSGAFSYMNGAKVTLEEIEKYVERYISFIKKYKIKKYFQIDVDNIFGLEKVEKWTEKMEKEIGYQCIPVWHKSRGVEYWKKMCKEYKYIVIGGLVFHVKKQEHENIRKLVEYAYNQGVKVHGLGFTRTKTLDNYKFYSVDSATWNVAASRGQRIYYFKDGDVNSHRINRNGKKVDLKRLVAHNMVEWVKFQYYMDGENR